MRFLGAVAAVCTLTTPAATGARSFDADGNGAGAAVHIATPTAGLSLTSADFLVV
jgi:hypothetical protein